MREEIISLIDTDSLPSLLYWNSILNYFERNKPNLTLEELEFMANESERCRNYFNKDRLEQQTIYKNGKEMEITVCIKGLEIAQSAVNPDIVWYYKYVRSMEQDKITQKLAQKVAELPVKVPDETWAHDLALELCQAGD